MAFSQPSCSSAICHQLHLMLASVRLYCDQRQRPCPLTAQMQHCCFSADGGFLCQALLWLKITLSGSGTVTASSWAVRYAIKPGRPYSSPPSGLENCCDIWHSGAPAVSRCLDTWLEYYGTLSVPNQCTFAEDPGIVSWETADGLCV